MDQYVLSLGAVEFIPRLRWVENLWRGLSLLTHQTLVTTAVSLPNGKINTWKTLKPSSNQPSDSSKTSTYTIWKSSTQHQRAPIMISSHKFLHLNFLCQPPPPTWLQRHGSLSQWTLDIHSGACRDTCRHSEWLQPPLKAWETPTQR